MNAALREFKVLDRIHNFTQVRPLYKLLRFWQTGMEIYFVLLGPKTNLLGKFLLNPSHTCLEWPASFFGLSLPSVSEGQFQISFGEAPVVLNKHCSQILSVFPNPF